MAASLVKLGQLVEPFFGLVLAWGWLLVLMVMLWVIWKIYLLIKRIDYIGGIQWTYFQISLPELADQTPKAMENLYDVLDGIHKNGDLVEKFFDGYLEAWYSCELHCTKGRARYIMVVPTVHKTFFEGVIYGQYPQAEVVEVEDYTQRYSYDDIDEKFDVYGAEIILVEDDIFPVRSYLEFADTLSAEDTYVDPHQAMVEAYTNIKDTEEFWVQILIRPIDGGDIKTWALKGEAEIDKLAGKEVKPELGLIGRMWQGLWTLPADMVKAAIEGPLEPGSSRSDRLDFPKVSAGDMAKMDGILRKLTRGGYRVKMRVVYLAPVGELTKPNIGRLIGGFKQFNTYNLNSFKPDADTKTNGPNYFFKQTRRYRRKREILLFFQWRDFFTYEEGFMLSAEELATIYHFPTLYMRAPAVERAKAGVGSAPDNVPYAS